MLIPAVALSNWQGSGSGYGRARAADVFPTTCPGAGSATVATSSADVYVTSNPSGTHTDGTRNITRVGRPSVGVINRTLIRFAMPAIPAGCSVTAATMSLTTVGNTSGRTLIVERNTQAWDETAVTWDTKPAVTTAGSTSKVCCSSNSAQTFDVTLMTQAGAADGFTIRDNIETSTALQTFATREHTTVAKPSITVSWS